MSKTKTEIAVLLASLDPNSDPHKLIDKLVEEDFFLTEEDAALFIYEAALNSLTEGSDEYPINYKYY